MRFVCLLQFALVGCAASTRPPVLSPQQALDVANAAMCEKTIREQIAANRTCPAAQTAINAAPECIIVFPMGLSLDCKEFRGTVKQIDETAPYQRAK